MKPTSLILRLLKCVNPLIRLLVFFIVCLIISCNCPKNEKGAYETNEYRNLFVEIGYSPEEVDLKIEKAFQQLFYGDSSQVIYFEDGENENGKLAYLADINSNDIRSEGMSYGMMICVQMNKKEEFDALWNWALANMYVDKEGHPNKGYFSWSIFYDGKPRAETPAPDGEEYFATALYFAAHRWGNGEGIYNYNGWANRILTNVRHREVITGPTLYGERSIGNMVSEEHHMIRFVPDIGSNEFTDPSYHLPGFYELWARWGPEEDRQFWAIAADSSRNFFYKHVDQNTGLCTDYANFDGTKVQLRWNPRASTFAYDSWRTQSNWAFDYSWWKKDPREVELSNRLQKFFASFGIDKFGHRFTQEGEVLDSGHRAGLVATSAVMSLAADHEIASDFVEEFWNTPIPESHGERYYDGTLYMMSLLHCSGQFKIWKPE